VPQRSLGSYPSAGAAGGSAISAVIMLGYTIRRILQAIVVTYIVITVTFVLLHLLPGGPVRVMLGARASPAMVAHFNRVYGYDQPWIVQYVKYGWQLLRGDLGYSVKLNVTVGSQIALDLPKTVVLIGLGLVVSLLLGVPLGIYQAVRRGTVADHLLTGVSFVGYAMPEYFLGLLLIDWFAASLHVFPASAPQGTSVGQVLSQPRALVLPVLTYAFLSYAGWSRYMRSSVMENLIQDYVRTARAKGAAERRVLWGHVFRNSLLTVVTLLGLALPGLVGGSVIVEQVFNYAGMGQLFAVAASNYDFQMLLGITLVGTVATIAGNLLADITYALLDPRVRIS
jgi:peptide/nickel transport system permease protein